MPKTEWSPAEAERTVKQGMAGVRRVERELCGIRSDIVYRRHCSGIIFVDAFVEARPMLMRATLYALALWALSGAAGCGHAAYRYHGTVAEAQSAGHSFNERPNQAKLRPIAGAIVYVYTDSSVGSWDGPQEDRCPDLLSIPTDRFREGAVTNSAGEFDSGVLGPPEWHGVPDVTVCVAAKGYEPYHFTSKKSGTGNDPTDSQYLDVRLKPTSR